MMLTKERVRGVCGMPQWSVKMDWMFAAILIATVNSLIAGATQIDCCVA